MLPQRQTKLQVRQLNLQRSRLRSKNKQQQRQPPPSCSPSNSSSSSSISSKATNHPISNHSRPITSSSSKLSIERLYQLLRQDKPHPPFLALQRVSKLDPVAPATLRDLPLLLPLPTLPQLAMPSPSLTRSTCLLPKLSRSHLLDLRSPRVSQRIRSSRRPQSQSLPPQTCLHGLAARQARRPMRRRPQPRHRLRKRRPARRAWQRHPVSVLRGRSRPRVQRVDLTTNASSRSLSRASLRTMCLTRKWKM